MIHDDTALALIQQAGQAPTCTKTEADAEQAKKANVSEMDIALTAKSRKTYVHARFV